MTVNKEILGRVPSPLPPHRLVQQAALFVTALVAQLDGVEFQHPSLVVVHLRRLSHSNAVNIEWRVTHISLLRFGKKKFGGVVSSIKAAG